MAQKTKAEFDAMIAASKAQRAAFRAAILAHGERPFEAKTQWGTVFVSKDPRTPAKPWRISFFGASRREGEKAHPEGHAELRSFLEAIDELPAYGVNNVSQIRFEPPWSLNPMKNPFVHPGLPEEDVAAAKGEISTLIKLSKMSEGDRALALRFLSSLVNTLKEPRSEIAAMRSIEYDGVQIVSLVTAPGNVANGMEITAVLRRLARRAAQSGVIGHYPLGQFFAEPPNAQAARAARAEVAKQATEAEKKRLLEELKEERRLRSLTAKRAPTDKAAAKARAKLLEIDEPGMPVEHLGPVPVRGIETDPPELKHFEPTPESTRLRHEAERSAKSIEHGDAPSALWAEKKRLLDEAFGIIDSTFSARKLGSRQGIYNAAARFESSAAISRGRGADDSRRKARRLKEIADELGELERPSKPWGSEKSEIAGRMAQLELNPKRIVIGQGGSFVSLAALGLGKWAGRKRNPKPMPGWRKKACDDRCDVLVDMARKSGVIEKIERRFGVTLGRDYLDCGARACVWDLGDKVLKLTDDADDASTASYIKRFRDQLPEGDRDALAEVFEACMIEGRGGARRFWVVLAEKLDPLDDDEAQALYELHKMSRMGFRDIMSPGTENAFPTPGGQKALLAWRALGRLSQQGVDVSKDAHNRNWGRDAQGRLKLFDFGASGVPSFGGSAPECVLKNPAPIDRQRFFDLADAQRGAPESAMHGVYKAAGGGVIGPLAEHVGDLTHRMAERNTFDFAGYGEVKEKVDKTLRWLRAPYGFSREFQENLASNAKYDKVPLAEKKRATYAALQAYADEHRKLPAFNDMQRAARAAAVAVGELRFSEAQRQLEILEGVLKKGPAEWKRRAHELS